jgi:hypothetical protein
MSQLPNIGSHLSTRKAGTKDSLDFLPTPPWATRALCEKIASSLVACSVAEPACGRLDMARAIAEYMTPGEPLFCSDIVDRTDGSYGVIEIDYLSDSWQLGTDWTITNPPFIKACEFILKALDVSAIGVAMLVRTNFLEGQDRYRDLFSRRPPTRTLQFVERVPMFVDRLDPDGSTMTAYMWLVWEHECERRPMEWIAPCRARLEKPNDYTQYLQPNPMGV